MNGIGELTMGIIGSLLSHIVGCHPQEKGECNSKDEGRDNQNPYHKTA
jgi:hypothetical protein